MQAKPEEIQDRCLQLVAAAGELVIGLSANPELYDLHYLTRGLAKCSAYSERLAEMLSRLTQLRLQVLQAIDRAENLLSIADGEAWERSEEESWEGSEAAIGREIKRRTRPEQRWLRSWVMTEKFLVEVKTDVARRADVVKRADSDLRLHQKLIEAKITAGAMGRDDLVGKPLAEPEDVVEKHLDESMAGDVDIA